MYASHDVHRVRLFGGLVLAIPLDACEPQRESPGIARARLYVAESNLHHELRPHVHGDASDAERANLHEGRWYLRTKDSTALTIERFRMLLGIGFESGPEVKLSPPVTE